MINVILRLRRDNDFNYETVKNTFRPANGELCIVDDARRGVRAKIGDGTTVWNSLPYLDSTIVSNIAVMYGYLHDGTFYKEITHVNEMVAIGVGIYIDKATNSIYRYDESSTSYVKLSGVPTASASTPGIMKLYSALGNNEDGTMTQLAIKTAIESAEARLQAQLDAMKIILGNQEDATFSGFNIEVVTD